jgi:serine/threonine protein kinase
VLRIGDQVRTHRGRSIRIERSIAVGGQAELYRATELASGRPCALKLFHPHYQGSETERRVRFLVERELGRLSPLLLAPEDWFRSAQGLGHVAPWAPGIPLERYLETPEPFLQGIQLALALACAVDILHGQGICHGDISASNAFVEVTPGGTLQLRLIDLDNFVTRGVPRSPCLGQILYLSPELRGSAGHGPDTPSELFALATLIHEAILLRHPGGAGDSPEEFFRRMTSGQWNEDPQLVSPSAPRAGGYSVLVLNAPIMGLFRRSFLLVPEARPTAREWVEALKQALLDIHECPRPGCGYPVLVDCTKRACPGCAQPYPLLVLEAPTAAFTRVIDQGCLRIGRQELGGAPTVSQLHAVLRRVGPQTYLESLGQNHSYRLAAGRWIRLPEQRPVLLQAGDHLRFAEVEVRIRAA